MCEHKKDSYYVEVKDITFMSFNIFSVYRGFWDDGFLSIIVKPHLGESRERSV